MSPALPLPPLAPSTPHSPIPTKTPKLNYPINLVSMKLVMHNEDLLQEILLRLPAKYVVKFKSVCKKWLSLISPLMSSDDFRRQHTLRRLKLELFLILQTEIPPWFYPENPQRFYLNPRSRRMIAYTLSVPNQHDHIIIQSCNGLLLLKPEYLYPPSYNFSVYNPVTKESREITLTNGGNHPYVVEVGLAFNSSKSPHYNLVCVRSSSNTYAYKIEVYNSGSQTWKEMSMKPCIYPKRTSLSAQGVRLYWNNAIYWSSNREAAGYCCFDIAKNEMKTLPFPASDVVVANKNVYRRLQESNGHLFHIKLRGGDGYESVAVWELCGDDDWVLKQHRVLTSTAESWECPSILTLFVDTWSLLICRDGKMRIYSFINESYEDFLDARGQPFFQTKRREFNLMGFQFGETFALV